jgi:NAD(P)-dependent dehydrogenase (short-subunit alcohol dehydrogenase family)
MTNAKRIVLTGATRGLGAAMTAGFVAAGHTVYGCGRNATDIERLRQQYGAPHRFDAVDVADDAQVADWAKLILADGPPDLLINNAAVINENARLWEIAAADFDRLIDINIKGVANVIRHFVPAMVARASGAIVNFSSGWGRSTSPEVAPYCASKFAIEGLTRALAEELPPGMAAVPLSPGVIDTDMLRTCMGEAAGNSSTPSEWALEAVPCILGLTAQHNGSSLTVPGHSRG